jgi:hypothetical protein
MLSPSTEGFSLQAFQFSAPHSTLSADAESSIMLAKPTAAAAIL